MAEVQAFTKSVAKTKETVIKANLVNKVSGKTRRGGKRMNRQSSVDSFANLFSGNVFCESSIQHAKQSIQDGTLKLAPNGSKFSFEAPFSDRSVATNPITSLRGSAPHFAGESDDEMSMEEDPFQNETVNGRGAIQKARSCEFEYDAASVDFDDIGFDQFQKHHEEGGGGTDDESVEDLEASFSWKKPASIEDAEKGKGNELNDLQGSFRKGDDAPEDETPWQSFAPTENADSAKRKEKNHPPLSSVITGPTQLVTPASSVSSSKESAKKMVPSIKPHKGFPTSSPKSIMQPEFDPFATEQTEQVEQTGSGAMGRRIRKQQLLSAHLEKPDNMHTLQRPLGGTTVHSGSFRGGHSVDSKSFHTTETIEIDTNTPEGVAGAYLMGAHGATRGRSPYGRASRNRAASRSRSCQRGRKQDQKVPSMFSEDLEVDGDDVFFASNNFKNVPSKDLEPETEPRERSRSRSRHRSVSRSRDASKSNSLRGIDISEDSANNEKSHSQRRSITRIRVKVKDGRRIDPETARKLIANTIQEIKAGEKTPDFQLEIAGRPRGVNMSKAKDDKSPPNIESKYPGRPRGHHESGGSDSRSLQDRAALETSAGPTRVEVDESGEQEDVTARSPEKTMRKIPLADDGSRFHMKADSSNIVTRKGDKVCIDASESSRCVDVAVKELGLQQLSHTNESLSDDLNHGHLCKDDETVDDVTTQNPCSASLSVGTTEFSLASGQGDKLRALIKQRKKELEHDKQSKEEANAEAVLLRRKKQNTFLEHYIKAVPTVVGTVFDEYGVGDRPSVSEAGMDTEEKIGWTVACHESTKKGTERVPPVAAKSSLSTLSDFTVDEVFRAAKVQMQLGRSPTSLGDVNVDQKQLEAAVRAAITAKVSSQEISSGEPSDGDGVLSRLVQTVLELLESMQSGNANNSGVQIGAILALNSDTADAISALDIDDISKADIITKDDSQNLGDTIDDAHGGLQLAGRENEKKKKKHTKNKKGVGALGDEKKKSKKSKKKDKDGNRRDMNESFTESGTASISHNSHSETIDELLPLHTKHKKGVEELGDERKKSKKSKKKEKDGNHPNMNESFTESGTTSISYNSLSETIDEPSSLLDDAGADPEESQDTKQRGRSKSPRKKSTKADKEHVSESLKDYKNRDGSPSKSKKDRSVPPKKKSIKEKSKDKTKDKSKDRVKEKELNKKEEGTAGTKVRSKSRAKVRDESS